MNMHYSFLSLLILMSNLASGEMTAFIFDGSQQSIPDSLSMRSVDLNLFLLALLSISFFLIALARMTNNKSLQTIFTTFFSSHSIEQLLKEQHRLDSFSSVMLIINHFVGFSICLFLLTNRRLGFDYQLAIILALCLPILLFIQEIVALYLAAIITDEQKRVSLALTHSIVGYEFSGLIYALLALFWIVNPNYNGVYTLLLIAVFCLKYLFRLFKSSFAVLTNGVSWYYLILYFCTLEILPPLVVALAFQKDFMK